MLGWDRLLGTGVMNWHFWHHGSGDEDLLNHFPFNHYSGLQRFRKYGISGVLTQNSKISEMNLPHKVLKDSYRKIGRITNQRSAYTLARYLDTGLWLDQFKLDKSTLLLNQGSILAQTWLSSSKDAAIFGNPQEGRKEG